MPNWCAGTLRFRGKKENVMRFLNRGFEIYNARECDENMNAKYVCKLTDRIKQEDLEANYEVSVDLNDNGEYIYISDTRRAFVEWDPQLGIWNNAMMVYYQENLNDYDISMMVILPVKQAWGFDEDNWADISKKYDIDIHLFGWEQGMQFEDEIEIHSGEVVKSNVREYTDWFWECPNPFIGG